MDAPRLPKVLSASLVALLLSTAGILNAQDRHWDEQMTRARDAIEAGRYAEGAELATDAMNLIGQSDAKDPRRPQTMNVLAAAKHSQGRFLEAEVLFKDAITQSSSEKSRQPGSKELNLRIRTLEATTPRGSPNPRRP